MLRRCLFALGALVFSTFTAPAQDCGAGRIAWAPGLAVTIEDFRAAPGDARHTAEANTGIATESRVGADASTFVVRAETFFDPCKSWFRRTDRSAETLAHEQLHFDITEVYARRLVARYAAEIDSHAAFLRKHARLYDQVWAESRRTQERYDREVYDDPAAQATWSEWVRQELAATRGYANKEVVLPMR